MGCCLDLPYVEYARQNYPHIEIDQADALNYTPRTQPDIVLCTAGLHHLTEDQQPRFVNKVAREMKTNLYFLVGEVLIRECADERERRLAVLELSSALIRHLIERDAPDEVIEPAIDVLNGDLFKMGEHKFAKSKLVSMLEPDFHLDRIEQVWPRSTKEFGDFLVVCRKK
jgi:hypothetical protein